MFKKEKNLFTEYPGLVTVASFFALFAVNGILLSLANMFLPEFVVLGTMSLTPTWAIVLSMGTLSWFLTMAMNFSGLIESWMGRALKPMDWMLHYFVFNFVGIWTIARFSDVFGMGLSAWYVAAILAVIFDVVQGVVMMQIEKIRLGE